MEVGGWTGDTVGGTVASGGAVARQGETVYFLPDMGSGQNDHNWGAWCSFCHQMEAHGRDESVNCTSGHMHGGGKF